MNKKIEQKIENNNLLNLQKTAKKEPEDRC